MKFFLEIFLSNPIVKLFSPTLEQHYFVKMTEEPLGSRIALLNQSKRCQA